MKNLNAINSLMLSLLSIIYNETTDLFADDERSQYSKTEINKHEAWLIYDEENINGTLVLVGSNISVSISGDLSLNELIKIAENIE